MDNMEIYEKVRAVPQAAKKEIKGGRMSGKTDINPMWRLKTLTEIFGPCGIGWYYNPVRKWIEESGQEKAAFVDIELYIKTEDGWSKPIAGTGGSSFVSKEKNGLFVSDECFKMATTDAISVACKQLGIGADVYWDKDTTKYTHTKNATSSQISKSQGEDLLKELARTGIGARSLCQSYGINSIPEMRTEDFDKAIKTLKSKPNKPIDPATIPPDNDDSGLPWNNTGVLDGK